MEKQGNLERGRVGHMGGTGHLPAEGHRAPLVCVVIAVCKLLSHPAPEF